MSFWSTEHVHRLWLIFSVVLMCCLNAATGLAAPAVGAMISNQATSTYLDVGTGYRATLNSNTVRLFVGSQEALSLTTPQQIAAVSGSTVTLHHILTNTGNITTSYTVTAKNLTNDQFDLAKLRLVHDLNGNGVQDGNEPAMVLGDTITLAAGKWASILVDGVVAATTPMANIANILVVATSTTTAVSVSNTDMVSTKDGAIVVLIKQVDKKAAVRTDVLNYTLSVSNIGNKAALSIAYLLNGVVQLGVVLRDIIPVNTTFSAFTGTAGGVPIYHLLGSPTHHYQSTPPAQLSTVDAVAVAYPNFSPNTSREASFRVVVNPNAAGKIPNHAAINYTDTINTNLSVVSNTVLTDVPIPPPVIEYYTDDTLTAVKPAMVIGEPLFIGADAAACNIDPTLVEQHPVQVVSKLTGDTETYNFIETGPNTGIYHYVLPTGIPTADASLIPTIHGNGVVETLNMDTLTATIIGCTVSISAQTTILVDPGGVVFDSMTGQPVAGVTVSLIDVTGGGNGGAAGGFATVFLLDGVTPSPNTVVTDSYGRFLFPLVAPSTYRLKIAQKPAAGYTFPSLFPATLLPAGFTILGSANAPATSGSYGGTFNVTIASGTVVLDVPIDPAPTIGLFVNKVASRTDVQLGEFLNYSITVKNTLTVPQFALSLFDVLPHGFSYVPHSLKQDGLPLPEPIGGRGPTLKIFVGTIAAGGTSVITYRVNVGPGSMQGDATNRAWAQNLTQHSNIALAKVNVTAGMLGDQAYMFGKVFLDCDHNRVQGAEEPGVPNVRLYLETGTNVITDAEGKWSLYGIRPRTHVMKVDPISVPVGAEWINLSNRHGGVADSQFVDLKNGDWHRVDFAISNCSKAIRQEVYQRRQAGEVLVSEIKRVAKVPFAAARPAAIVNSDIRLLPAQGVLNQGNPIAGFKATKIDQVITHQNSNVPESPVAVRMRLEVKTLMQQMDHSLGFIDLRDGDVLPYRQTNIRVKGFTDSKLLLQINNKRISVKKAGKKSSDYVKRMAVWEYIAMDLQPGENVLQIKQVDAFGNVRGNKKIKVIAPDDLAHIRLTVPKSADSDGHSLNTVLVELLDAHDVPVTIRTPLTLESNLGRWKAKDLNPAEPGVQVYMAGGSVEFNLISPQQQGETKIRVSSGTIKSMVHLDFLPPLRPMVAVGVLEGRMAVHSFNLKNIQPVRQRDGFEQQLRLMSRSNGKFDAAGRAAVFLKGRVLGKYLLTAAYDSDKQTKDKMFRDISPNEFYPIYGDSAIKGFDAQSTGRLYVRVDKGRSWLLYGDFGTINMQQQARKLATYNRSLTGVKQHYENKFLSVEAFGSEGVSKQVIEELAANGTSGPYYLSNKSILTNSETIEIITRDRNQSSIILSIKKLQRFNDYQIDQLTQRIVFTTPLASLDENLNPNYIRATYEVDQGGKTFLLGGVSGVAHLGDYVDLGVAAVRDQNPKNSSKLGSVFGTIKVSKKTKIHGEFARSNNVVSGTGDGAYLELLHQGEKAQFRVHAGRTAKTFDNPGSFISSGREEAGLDVTLRVGAKTSILSKLLHTKDRLTGGQRRGLELSVDQMVGDWIKAELGYRRSDETLAPAMATSLGTGVNRVSSVRSRLSSQLPGLPSLGIYGEYEQDIQQKQKRTLALGGEYQIMNRGRLYARHEFMNSLSGSFGLTPTQRSSATLFGIDTDYMKDGKIFSEYRMRDAISGRESGAAIGLRNLWHVAEGIRLNTSLERVSTFSGIVKKNSTAVTAAIAYTINPLRKLTVRTEFRRSSQEDSMLIGVGAAQKLDLDWSLLVNNTFSVRKQPTLGSLTQERMQIGFAYRDVDSNRLSWLGMYEMTLQNDTGLQSRQLSHLVSTHANYQPVQPIILTGRYAIKWINSLGGGVNERSAIQLLAGRAMVDITEKWDAGMVSQLMVSRGITSKHYGVGVEAGYLLTANMWLTAGYNVFGFKDKNLLSDNYSDKGLYMRLRYKFDEKLFDDPSTGE